MARLQPGDVAVIAGDFNDQELTVHDFRDAWEGAEGYTFDPSVNLVARRVVAAVGGSGAPRAPRRLDRVYVRGAERLQAELVATEPFTLDGGGPWPLGVVHGHLGAAGTCRTTSACCAGSVAERPARCVPW